MTVKPATMFGKGLEIICRLRLWAAFCGAMVIMCRKTASGLFCEVTLKDDARQDPP